MLDPRGFIMEKKICFVVMGFGKKKDPATNRTIDLDATYKKIIRPAVEQAKCKCIRADEIVESAIIDKSMYALLYRADVVIADISTYNPNAIYELGVRHSLRPYSTIIIKEDEGNIPFDISHNRMVSYKHLGNEISDQEAKKCVQQLKRLVESVVEHPETDSPLYTYIPTMKKPSISDEEIESIVRRLSENEESVYALTEKAKKMMAESDFCGAEKIWGKLCTKVENEKYYTQQQALCKYKSEYPSKRKALTDALGIMSKIENQTDTETLGILGAINKRLWEEMKDPYYLEAAIDAYKKGWNLHKDYYTGENYANCLMMLEKILEGDLSTHAKVEARLTFEEVVNIVLASLEEDEPEELMWKYATLANSYYALGRREDGEKNEVLFKKQNPDAWQVQTFEKTKQMYVS